jgi:magnesium chelatase family protein
MKDIQEIRGREAKVRVQGSLEACRLTLTKDLDFFKSSRGEIDDLQLAIYAIERSNPQIKYLAGLSVHGRLEPVRWLDDPENGRGCKILVVCSEQAQLAAEFFPHLVVVAFGTFQEVLVFADSTYPIVPSPYEEEPLNLPPLPSSLHDVYAQASAAIAAGKNVVLTSERVGTGATKIARRLVRALGPLTHKQAIEVSRIHANVGLTTTLVRSRPFRAPHHTVSEQGLFGRVQPTPQQSRAGECLLATHGILFLDEGHEFRRASVTEIFRQQQVRGTFRVVMAWHVSKRTPAPPSEQLAEWNAVEVKI